jgi:hypothetical protein
MIWSLNGGIFCSSFFEFDVISVSVSVGVGDGNDDLVHCVLLMTAGIFKFTSLRLPFSLYTNPAFGNTSVNAYYTNIQRH